MKVNIKFIFETKNFGTFNYEIKKESNNKFLKKSSIEMKAGALPIAFFSFKIDKDSYQILNLKREDKITLFVDDKKNKYRKLFSGEIIEIKKHFEKNIEYPIMDIKLISPLLKLQMIYLNQNVIENCNGLRELIKKIMDYGNIDCSCIIDDDIDDDINISFINNISAFSLLQIIFLQKNLLMNSNHGDDLLIIEKIKEIKNIQSKPVIEIKAEDIVGGIDVTE